MIDGMDAASTSGYERLAYKTSPTGHVRQEVSFNAPVDDVFDALVDARQFAAMSGSRARGNVLPGGRFSYFNGMVEGTNLEVDAPSMVVQSWRLRHWQRDCFSVVAFRLHGNAGGTRLLLQQWGFPEDQNLEPMWDRMYWIPIRRFLTERQHSVDGQITLSALPPPARTIATHRV
jgi:activator of HSP90 ATPase